MKKIATERHHKGGQLTALPPIERAGRSAEICKVQKEYLPDYSLSS